jgi:hypothetical protein
MDVNSTIRFSLLKGFGEFFWNLCLVCGNASVKTTFWEDGTVEHSECLICARASEIMELEEIFSRESI